MEVPDFVLASPVSFDVAEDVLQAFLGALGPPPPALLEEWGRLVALEALVDC